MSLRDNCELLKQVFLSGIMNTCSQTEWKGWKMNEKNGPIIY